MKKLFFFLLLMTGFVATGYTQTGYIRNHTDCPIWVNVICFSGIRCSPPNPVPVNWTFIPAKGNIFYSFCPGGPAFTILHFYFADECNTNDPFVAAPGNCAGYPSTVRQMSYRFY